MIRMAEKLALTREEYKKLKQTSETEQTAAAAEPVHARPIPVWLRFVMLIILIFVFAAAGAIVGYSGIGHGKVTDVLKGSAFSHVYDLVEKK
jgi:flagellar basal body-associated protein FliL